LGDKQGEVAKAKRAEKVETPRLYRPSVPRLWSGKDSGFDGGAGDVVTYKILKDSQFIYCYPDTTGNDVEYIDWDVSYGNLYYYTIYAEDGEPNSSEGAGPVIADLTNLPGDGCVIAAPWSPYGADIGYNPYAAPNVSAPAVESGWGASGVKISRVITCKPNPVTGTAPFTITLPSPSRVRLDIYDLSGRSVETLLDKYGASSYEQVEWHPTLSPGIYIYQLTTPASLYSGKVVIIN